MKWTKEKPKVAGWYWCKYKAEWYDVATLEVVKVISFSKMSPCDTIVFNGNQYTLDDKSFTAFAGPIRLPEGE